MTGPEIIVALWLWLQPQNPETLLHCGMAVASVSQQLTVTIILSIKKEATSGKISFSALKGTPCPHFFHHRLFGDLHSYMSEKQVLILLEATS